MSHAVSSRSAPRIAATPIAPTSIAHRRLVGRDFTAIATAEVQPEELARIIAAPEQMSVAAKATVIKRGRSALIVRVDLPIGSIETRTAYKLCGGRTWLRRLARGLKTSAARRNFQLGHKLLRCGIDTPRPLLAVSPRWHNFLSPSFLATEWIEGGLPLDVFAKRSAAWTPAQRRARMRDTARCLGQLIGTLHKHRFSHRDLKSTNLLAREKGDRVEVFLIDLDGATRSHFRLQRTRVKNLSRLQTATSRIAGVSSTLRCRFLQTYLATLGSSANWKTVWRQLQKASRIPPLRTG